MNGGVFTLWTYLFIFFCHSVSPSLLWSSVCSPLCMSSSSLSPLLYGQQSSALWLPFHSQHGKISPTLPIPSLDPVGNNNVAVCCRSFTDQSIEIGTGWLNRKNKYKGGSYRVIHLCIILPSAKRGVGLCSLNICMEGCGCVQIIWVIESHHSPLVAETEVILYNACSPWGKHSWNVLSISSYMQVW